MGDTRPRVGDGEDSSSGAIVETRIAEEKVVTHLGLGINLQVDGNFVGSVQGEPGGAWQTQINAISQARVGGVTRVRRLEVGAAEVARK